MKMLLRVAACVAAMIMMDAAAGDMIIFGDGSDGQSGYQWSRNRVAEDNRDVAKLENRVVARGGESLSQLSIALTRPTSATASWVSDRFQLAKRSYLVVNARISTAGVHGVGDKTWHRAALTIQYFDGAGAYVGQEDIVRISGTHAEEDFKKVLVVPDKAISAGFVFGMIEATGTAILHSLKAQSRAYEAVHEANEGGLAIYPKPWRQECENAWRPISYMNVGFEGSISSATKAAVIDVLREDLGFRRVVLDGRKRGASEGNVNFRLLDIERDSVTSNSIQPDGSPELHNSGGYRLDFDRSGEAIDMSVTAGDETGLLYSAQTLRQLIRKGDAGGYEVRICQIRDWPVLKIRGIGTGRMSAEYIQQLSRYKINEVQISGAPGVWSDWDRPITVKASKDISEIGKTLRKYGVSGAVAIWPGGYGRIFSWTSENDRRTLADKSLIYRQAGFDSLLLVLASDYERVGRGNGVLAKEDLVNGYSLSAYHVALAKYLLDFHMRERSGMKIEMFPFYYLGAREYGDVETSYLKEVSALSEGLMIIYGGNTSTNDIAYLSHIIGRKPLVRLPAPGATGIESGVDGFNLRQIMSERFSAVDQDSILGLVIETPNDESSLRVIADYMWNYGRTMH